MNQSPDLDALLADLGSASSYTREQAIAAFGQIGRPAIPGLLALLLGEGHKRARQSAAQALGQTGDPAAVPGLLAVLGDGDDILVWHAVNALGEIGNPAAIPGMMVLFRRHTNNFVRRAIPQALGSVAGEAALAGLLEAMADRDWLVRRGAALWLERLGSLAVPGLLGVLEHERSVIRYDAATMLRDMADPAAVTGLAARLGDRGATWLSKQRVGDVAAEALEQIGTPEALAALAQWREAQVGG